MTSSFEQFPAKFDKRTETTAFRIYKACGSSGERLWTSCVGHGRSVLSIHPQLSKLVKQYLCRDLFSEDLA